MTKIQLFNVNELYSELGSPHLGSMLERQSEDFVLPSKQRLVDERPTRTHKVDERLVDYSEEKRSNMLRSGAFSSATICTTPESGSECSPSKAYTSWERCHPGSDNRSKLMRPPEGTGLISCRLFPRLTSTILLSACGSTSAATHASATCARETDPPKVVSACRSTTLPRCTFSSKQKRQRSRSLFRIAVRCALHVVKQTQPRRSRSPV
jgi:hypothetical protein